MKNGLNRQLWLAVICCALLAMFVAVLVSQVYKHPILFPDTTEYMNATGGDPWAVAVRTPLYGWLINTSLAFGHADYLIWLQVASWIACITCLCLIVAHTTKSALGTLTCGITIIAADLYLMRILPLQWMLLSDALYTDWFSMGLLLMILSICQKRRSFLLLGSLCSGLAVAIRPMPIPLLLGMFAICISAWDGRKNWKQTGTTALIALLLLISPIGVRMLSNAKHLGTIRPTPLVGWHLSTYAHSLLKPGDKAFDDPALNRALHQAVEQHSLPPEYKYRDPWDAKDGAPWYWMLSLYASIAHEWDNDKSQYAVERISRATTFRLIRLHPTDYMRLAGGQFFCFLIPIESQRMAFWPVISDEVAPKTIFQMDQVPLSYKSIFYGPTGIADYSKMNMQIKRMLDLPQRIRHLPWRRHTSVEIAVMAMITFMMIYGMRIWIRDKTERRHLGMAIVFFVSATLLDALSQAMVTLVCEPRHQLHGIMAMEITLALTAAAAITSGPVRSFIKQASKFPYQKGVL